LTGRLQTLDRETALIDYASYPELVSGWLSIILLGLLFGKALAIDVAKQCESLASARSQVYV